MRKYELDVQEYDKQKAEAQAEQKEFPGKHPFMKLTKLDKDVVEKKDLVLKGGPRIVVIHCTHGFNRSGFMFCHYMKRFGPSLSVAACVKAYVPALSTKVILYRNAHHMHISYKASRTRIASSLCLKAAQMHPALSENLHQGKACSATQHICVHQTVHLV